MLGVWLQEAMAIVDPKNWVQLLDTDEVAKKRLAAIYRAPTPEMMCYLDFSVSTTGMLAGVKVSGHWDTNDASVDRMILDCMF